MKRNNNKATLSLLAYLSLLPEPPSYIQFHASHKPHQLIKWQKQMEQTNGAFNKAL